MRSQVLRILSLSCLWALSPACLPDRCKTPSANIELTITFSGFSLSSARRVEFETAIEAPTPAGAASDTYYEQRLGSVSYPSGLASQNTYLLNTGNYLNQQAKLATRFRLFVRVYGEKNGHPDALLAEGYKEWAPLDAGECYIDERMKVTSSPSCSQKLEGDPCVSPSQDWQPRGVCQPSGDALRCLPSRCGDGFTDRRGGEICDPGDDPTPRAPCTADCLTEPRQVIVNGPQETPPVTPESVAGNSALIGYEATLTESAGIWSLDATTTPDLHGSLLVADVDSDGTDELFLGLPGARYDHPSPPAGTGCPGTTVGVVYAFNWPMVGDKVYGSPTGPDIRINGPCSAHTDLGGASFGASLAAGDLDGDGALDLVVGAPRADGNDGGQEGGQVFVLFGGTNGAISVIPTPKIDAATDDLPKQIYSGTNGDWGAGKPGDYLGYAAVVADFDLDGYADVAVSAPQRKVPSEGVLGAVYLIRGGPEFRGRASSAVGVSSLASLQIEVGVGRSGARLGVSLASGDVNGDGYPDLVMGTTSGDAAAHEGGLSILFGHDALFARTDDISNPVAFPFSPKGAGDFLSLDILDLGLGTDLLGLGGTVAVVDLDGDGLAEVAATLGRSPWGDAPGTVALFRGAFFERLLPVLSHSDIQPPGPSEITYVQGPIDSDFGLTLAVVDVSGDRRPDLLIGAPGEAYEAPPAPAIPQAGAVYAILSTPRAQWFDSLGPQHLDLVALREGGEDAPPIPFLWLRGSLAHGRFGTAMTGSSHLSQAKDEPQYRSAYTHIFEPGRPPYSGLGSNAGRVWEFFLPGLLPCESLATCAPRSD